MQIIAKNLSFTYGKQTKAVSVKALNNVNLTIEEGDFFGIIGHTGSGKSTFVQHLNGLIRVNGKEGELRVGEFDLADKKCDLKTLRSKVGMVFQYPEYQLFAETVFEDVAFGLKSFNKDISQSEIELRVAEAITTVGLNYQRIKDKSPFELSGGQKRRVAIAGVIVSRPEVLVLDEPAAGLDPVGKREFLNLLKRLHSSFVKTIIIVSHDMNIISEYCNKVAVFNRGEIALVGTPQEVFADQNKIKELGLEFPLTARLKLALKNKGVEVGGDLTVEGFVTALSKLKEEGKL
ncbi:MAG: energy-coupling factor transporter ATPase [Clostridia bacterium]|nr:energy-coupling factor transporter ATPase [Clostridia bacterium]